MLRIEEVCCLLGNGATLPGVGALRDATAASSRNVRHCGCGPPGPDNRGPLLIFAKYLPDLITESSTLPSVRRTYASPKVPTTNCSVLYVCGPPRTAGSVGPYLRYFLGADRPVTLHCIREKQGFQLRRCENLRLAQGCKSI
jgi:hypothetical protein